MHGRGYIYRDRDGKPLRVTGVDMDITERKAAEDALASALERVSSHVSNSPLAVIEWDADWRICQWSKQAERVFGYTREEMMGVSGNDWNYIHEGDRARVEEEMKRIAEVGLGVCGCRNLTRSGDVIHCEWYNTFLKDDSGRLTSVLS